VTRSRIVRRFRSYGVIVHIPRGPYIAFRRGYLHRTRYSSAMHYHWTTRPVYGAAAPPATPGEE
jgi:hypothetical protein